MFRPTPTNLRSKTRLAKEDRVIILHIDDVGMSYDTNVAVKAVLENGAARSLSVMMPTPWVPQIVRYIKERPGTDAGLHLTLTAEWRDYRWGPLAGAAAVPGLTDPEGALWRGVGSVVSHASADEVDREVRANWIVPRRWAFIPPTSIRTWGPCSLPRRSSRSRCAWASKSRFPLCCPAGTTLTRRLTPTLLKPVLRKCEDRSTPFGRRACRCWTICITAATAGNSRRSATMNTCAPGVRGSYMQTMRQLKPGVIMVIMHCTSPTAVFAQISDSGDLRKAHVLTMLDPNFKAFLKKEGFIITTWKEIHERRQRLAGR